MQEDKPVTVQGNVGGAAANPEVRASAGLPPITPTDASYPGGLVGSLARAEDEISRDQSSPIQLSGNSYTAEFNPTQYFGERNVLEFKLGALPVSITQEPDIYLDSIRRRDTIDEPAVRKIAPSRTFVLNVAGEELVVSFPDINQEKTIRGFNQNDIEEIQRRIEGMAGLLTRDDIEVIRQFESLMEKAAQKSLDAKEQAAQKAKEFEESREIKLKIGRKKDQENKFVLGIEVDEDFKEQQKQHIKPVKLTRLSKWNSGDEKEPTYFKEEDCSIDGTSIELPLLQEELRTVSATHATISFKGDGSVTITDGNESSGSKSTNSTFIMGKKVEKIV